MVHDDPAARWQAEVAAELATPFVPTEAPLIRAVLIHADQDAALVLVAHHAIADGMSLAFAIRDVLRVLAGDPLELLPLTPSEDELLQADPDGAAPFVTNDVPPREASGTKMRYRAPNGRAGSPLLQPDGPVPVDGVLATKHAE